MNKINSGFIKNGSLIDNSNRIAKIAHRFKAYKSKFISTLFSGVPVRELVITQFPFWFKDNPVPPIVTIELTNYCDLKCNYCPNSLGLRPKGFMEEGTFEKLIRNLEESNISRLRIVGYGEPTLHPFLGSYAKELAKSVKYLSIVTNGQWKNPELPLTLLSSPLNLIEISVEGISKQEYESCRIGANYGRLINNLKSLRTIKAEFQSKTLINIRLMVRPSHLKLKSNYKDYMSFWSRYADIVMPQFITHIKETDYQDDVFLPLHRINRTIPKCSLPFKHLEIRWTGQVILCGSSVLQYGNGGVELGNINEDSIDSLWNGKTMKRFRNGHRHKKYSEIEMCRGCMGY